MALSILDAATHELTLFAAIFLAIGGMDDFVVDVLFIGNVVSKRRGGSKSFAAVQLSASQHRFAIFVPAWDESPVIAAMLRSMLDRWRQGPYRIYVGTYPNDRATIAAVLSLGADDRRVRLVVGPRPGPTTKADCLNSLWAAMERDEAAEGHGFTAVVLHDAEDVVHPKELAVYSGWIDRYAAVQIPVAPLCQPRSRLVSGHYVDEFAQSHGATLPVRQMVGASLPLAGVGCAIRCDLLRRLAEARGVPFDATSLTEDYELGLSLRTMGARSTFVRVPERPGGPPVAVHAYFPATVSAAVRQKARWMAGIALAGWDRTGWGRPGDLGDHWMRMRDRRVTLAMPVLAIAYAALPCWGLSALGHAWVDAPPPAQDALLDLLVGLNLLLLGWRFAMRTALVTRLHGWREGCWVAPRMVVANYITLLAARRALWIYVGLLAGGPLRWDKTAHQFPGQLFDSASAVA